MKKMTDLRSKNDYVVNYFFVTPPPILLLND